MATNKGQCLCGGVSFAAEVVEKKVGACHCIMCQRWSGGPLFATTAGNIEFKGEENLTRFKSSDWAERGFCNICGSNLFYRVLNLDTYEMCVGAFDDKEEFVLASEIFVDRKPDGYALAGDHDRLTEAETLAKYRDFAE